MKNHILLATLLTASLSTLGCPDHDARFDFDGDGVEDSGDGDLEASLGSGGEDCDDNDATAYPDAPEIPDEQDNDCDDEVDEDTEAADDDGDGYCEDQDQAVYPGNGC